MGTELSLYRARIGTYTFVQHRKKSRVKTEKYRATINGTDIHLRSFVCSVYLTFMMLMCYGILLCNDYAINHCALKSEFSPNHISTSIYSDSLSSMSGIYTSSTSINY